MRRVYFSTELFVPIADWPHSAGVGVGAIVALTISGAGANLPEFIVLSKMAKPVAITIFFGYVFAVAMTGGLLAHTLTTSPMPRNINTRQSAPAHRTDVAIVRTEDSE